jgi:hypothetical protein
VDELLHSWHNPVSGTVPVLERTPSVRDTSGVTVALSCAQCGRPLPSEAAELAAWKHGELAAAGELDETSAGLLVCPECLGEHLLGEFDAGEPG